MAYVRHKTINGKRYFYLVETKREGDIVRQRHIKYLGKNPSVSEIEIAKAQAQAGDIGTT